MENKTDIAAELGVKKAQRVPFEVWFTPVTEENMTLVAQWCNGRILTGPDPLTNQPVKYIKVWVQRTLNKRQSMAYVGDRVLYTKTGFKVYTPEAFDRDFELVEDKEVTILTDKGPEKSTVSKLMAEFQPAE